MLKRILGVLVSLFIAHGALAQTINNLGAGSAVSGTDLFPAYQGANPATAVSAAQLKTFIGPRNFLASTINYYVTAAGSDSNDCLSFGTGCASVQHALDLAYKNNDGGSGASTSAVRSYVINIQSSQTFSGANGTFNMVGPLPGGGIVTITSIAANATLTVSGTTPTVWVQNGARVLLKNITLAQSGTGPCLQATAYGQAIIGTGVIFSNCGASMIESQAAAVSCSSAPTISGNAVSFAHATYLGYIACNVTGITCTGSPAFSQYFVGYSQAYIEMIGTTFTNCGTVTGPRFTGNRNGGFRSNTNNLTFLPGNSSGTLASNAVYDDYGATSLQSTVAGLSSYPCTSNQTGIPITITDASAPSWNGTLTGGGSTVVTARCNGSSWVAQ